MSGSNPGPSVPPKPRKFKPTIPQRRKKADEAEVKVKTEDDENFKDLLRAAQDPGNWERKQHGRRRDQSSAPQRVVFGGAAGFGTASGRPGSSVGSIKTAAGPSGQNGAAGHSARGGGSQKDDHNFAGATRRLGKLGDKVEKAEKWEADMKDGRLSPPAPEELAEEDMLNYDSYYPTTLPIRPPGSLPEPEDEPGGLGAADMPHDQSEDVNVAERLGLLDLRDDEDNVADMLFQLPSLLPVPVKEIKREPLDRRKLKTEPAYHQSAHTLKDLPPGKIGKLIVFQSGKVKLQMGDVLMDVNLGSDCHCLQQVLAMNTSTKTAVVLGEIQNRAICTPDMDHLLSETLVPDWERDTADFDAKVQAKREERALKQSASPSPMDTDESKPPSLNGMADVETEVKPEVHQSSRRRHVIEEDDE